LSPIRTCVGSHEQEYRRTSLENLRGRQKALEEKRDILTERFLEDRIPEKEYRRKYTEYDRELYDLNVDIERVQNARDLYVEELELLSKLGGQLAEIFRISGSEKKRTIVKVLASNATLEGGKARLILFLRSKCWPGGGDNPKWWALQDLNLRPPSRQDGALPLS
jgi:hypothetical protein